MNLKTEINALTKEFQQNISKDKTTEKKCVENKCVERGKELKIMESKYAATKVEVERTVDKLEKTQKKYRDLLDKYTVVEKKLFELEGSGDIGSENMKLENILADLVAELRQVDPRIHNLDDVKMQLQEVDGMKATMDNLRRELENQANFSRELKHKLTEAEKGSACSELKVAKLENERDIVVNERDTLRQETLIYAKLKKKAVEDAKAYYKSYMQVKSDLIKQLNECLGDQTTEIVKCLSCVRRRNHSKRLFSRVAALYSNESFYQHFGMYHLVGCPFCGKSTRIDESGRNAHFKTSCNEQLQALDSWYWENLNHE